MIFLSGFFAGIGLSFLLVAWALGRILRAEPPASRCICGAAVPREGSGGADALEAR